MFEFRKAERKKSKLRLGIAGPAGSGKTLTSLLIAYGIAGDWEKIGLIDTENGSGDLYANTTKTGITIGNYNVLTLDAPYTPERYIGAIEAAEEAGLEIVIVDSLSHAWAGPGGVLEIQGKIADSGKGNSYTAWRTVTPRHNALVGKLLSCKLHLIATLRSKTEYVLETDDKGKQIPKKVGLAPIQREGMDYEFTMVLDMTHNHIATVSKDRTGIFEEDFFTPNISTGKIILDWLNSGSDLPKCEVCGVEVDADTARKLSKHYGFIVCSLECKEKKQEVIV